MISLGLKMIMGGHKMKIPLNEFTKRANLIRDNEIYKIYDLVL